MARTLLGKLKRGLFMTHTEFLEKAGKFAAGGTTAATLLASLSPNYAWAQQVPEGDPRIETGRMEYDSPQGHGKVKALLARPAGKSGKLPGVLVIHENRGLNPYVKDVARRFVRPAAPGRSGWDVAIHDGCGASRGSRPCRSEPDRSFAAIESSDVYQGIRRHPPRVCLSWRRTQNH